MSAEIDWFPGVFDVTLDPVEAAFLDAARARGNELLACGVLPAATGVVAWTGRAILEVEVELPDGFAHRLHVGFNPSLGLTAEPDFDGYILDGAPGPWRLADDTATPREAVDAAFGWFGRVLTEPLVVERAGSAARLSLERSGHVLRSRGSWLLARLSRRPVERFRVRPAAS
jgi:hypothetical protein